MAPSRGTTVTPHPDDAALTQQSNSAWTTARRNIRYLLNPTSATQTGSSPTRMRTRYALRALRSLTIFLFWRLVRWAKYAAVASIVAAVSATAVGGFVSGVGWVLAPPTLGASVLMYGVWSVGGWGAKSLHRRWVRKGGDAGEVEREDGREGTRRDGRFGDQVGPQVVPW